MAQEQLQLIITADNKEALKAIEDLAKSTEGLKYKFQQNKGATDAATQSLMNLSRVAQDAPYGFMGIANNINPLLESFQRLGERTKESGGAFKALREAMVGPAGVGLAVGVLSSVIVKYGDAIVEAMFKTAEFEKAQKAMRDAMAESVKSVADDVAKNEALLSVVNDVTESTKNRQAALDQLKSTYKGNLELQQMDINDGAKLTKVIDNISEALLRKAKIEAYAKLIAEEQAKIARDQIATVEDQVDKLNIWQKSIAIVSGAFNSLGASAANIGFNLVDAGLQKTNKEIQTSTTIVKGLTEGLKDLTKQSIQAGDALTLSTTAPKAPKTVKEKLSKLKFTEPSLYDADIEEMIRKQDKELGIGGRANILGDTFLTDTDKNKAASKLGFASGKKSQDDWFKDTKENFKELNQQALEFANTLSNTITNSIMGMWDALQQGTPVLEALGNMFLDLAKQIAAAAIKAAVFATILNFIPGLGGAASAGGFGGIFKAILGLPVTKNAEGGVTNGPSWGLIGEGNEREAIMPLSKLGTMMKNTFNAGAMNGNGAGSGGSFVLRGNDLVLALQRSNYSLNLRRGA
jgi:hypothetical protein